MGSYAVTWRERGGPLYAGKLELDQNGIRLEGGCGSGKHLSIVKLRYRDVALIAMSSFRDRLVKQPTLQVTARRGPLYIAPSGVGVAREVLEMVQGARNSRGEPSEES